MEFLYLALVAGLTSIGVSYVVIGFAVSSGIIFLLKDDGYSYWRICLSFIILIFLYPLLFWRGDNILDHIMRPIIGRPKVSMEVDPDENERSKN